MIHALVIFLPLLWMNWGHVQRAYGLPKGSGTASVGGRWRGARSARRRNSRPEEPQEVRGEPQQLDHLLQPRIDSDSRVMEESPGGDRADLHGHRRQGRRQVGRKARLGKGGGTQGGWPEGMEGAKVRFIRLQYRGGDWDYRTGSDADFNMLRAFAEITGFQVEAFAENIPIDALKQFPKDHAPPFVYITGTRGVEISAAEAKVLRWYLLDEGGMLFADSGSCDVRPRLPRRPAQACPELTWVDIPNDDIIYQQPFEFPNGVPPLVPPCRQSRLGPASTTIAGWCSITPAIWATPGGTTTPAWTKPSPCGRSSSASIS